MSNYYNNMSRCTLLMLIQFVRNHFCLFAAQLIRDHLRCSQLIQIANIYVPLTWPNDLTLSLSSEHFLIPITHLDIVLFVLFTVYTSDHFHPTQHQTMHACDFFGIVLFYKRNLDSHYQGLITAPQVAVFFLYRLVFPLSILIFPTHCCIIICARNY